MKILLLGNTGQVGWELERALQPLGSVIALDYKPLMALLMVGAQNAWRTRCFRQLTSRFFIWKTLF